jgi:hypothetical protein
VPLPVVGVFPVANYLPWWLPHPSCGCCDSSAVYALPISAVGFSFVRVWTLVFGSSYLNCGGMKDPSNVGIKISNRSEPNL